MLEWITGTGQIFGELGTIAVAAACSSAEGVIGWFNADFEGFECAKEPDFFPLRSLMRSEAAWVWGVVMTLFGGLLVAMLYRASSWIERYLEPTLMVVAYLSIGAIIFVEVIRRFVFSEQFPWSTTIPGYLFLIMTWTGCSYNVRLRTHLSFSEFRSKMPRGLQFGLLMLDAVLWWGICLLVIVTATFVVANSGGNYSLITGTDGIFAWWFLVTLPLAFVLLSGRVFQNFFEDIRKYRDGSTMIEQAVLGGQ